MDRNFWNGKSVFVTGHTGFKGSWLCLWLSSLGADVTGYALNPPTTPSLFELCGVAGMVRSVIADIRDRDRLREALLEANPEIVFHMAAQPIVRTSYAFPVDTFETNVMGTVHLLEAVRQAASGGGRIKAVVNVTTDKCYENREWPWGYRESDRLGGYDPYSGSKACAELATAAYRSSYFHPRDYERHGVAVATARAGNVIGGGDWAADRLVPDCVRALLDGKPVRVRNRRAIRPWQHVLEPLSGYMTLARKLAEEGPSYAEGWNFGPDDRDARPVEWIVRQLCRKWGEGASYEFVTMNDQPHEAHGLKLDCSKAKQRLGWHPRWSLDQALDKVVEWTRAYRDNENMAAVCLRQLDEYARLPAEDDGDDHR